MGENHLTYFKIENFKRFDSFEMENIGQFNLLVGDNNVGKTSILEGLLFNFDGDNSLANLYQTLLTRKLTNENTALSFDSEKWKLFCKKLDQPLKISIIFPNKIGMVKWEVVTFQDLTEKDWVYLEKRGYRQGGNLTPIFKNGLRFTMNEGANNYYPFSRTTNEVIKENIGYMPFISTNMSYDSDLLLYYYNHINSDKITRKEFEQNLKTFIPKLEEIRTQKFFDDTEMLGVVLEDENGIYPITRFGDGTVKLTRILLEILMANGIRLMIDEIDTGIHFSRLKDFWKMVITLCKQYDVQLFATTHSLECQRYFVEALTELGEEYQNDARNISLVEDSSGEVKAVTFDFKQFEFAMEIGYNTRGGI